jgi:hypothetical protein
MEGDASPTKFLPNMSLQAQKNTSIEATQDFWELERVANEEYKEQNSKDREDGSCDTRHLIRLDFVGAGGAGQWRWSGLNLSTLHRTPCRESDESQTRVRQKWIQQHWLGRCNH